MTDLPDAPGADRVEGPSRWRRLFATRRRRWVVGIVVVNLLALLVLAGVGSAHSNECGGFSGYSGGFGDCQADFSVSLTAIPRAIHVGDKLVYLATVRNHGPDRGFDAELNVQVPHNVAVSWALTSQRDYCEYEHFFVNCYIYDLEPDQAAAASIVIKALAPGSARAVATLDSRFDPNDHNNRASIAVPVKP